MATITFVRSDKQTLRLPLSWGKAAGDCGSGPVAFDIPEISETDAVTLAAFCGDAYAMDNVQYLYVEGPMTRNYITRAQRAWGDARCSWYIV